MRISDLAALIAFSTTVRAVPPGENPISKETVDGRGVCADRDCKKPTARMKMAMMNRFIRSSQQHSFVSFATFSFEDR
jgi:hypothetical protein